MNFKKLFLSMSVLAVTAAPLSSHASCTEKLQDWLHRANDVQAGQPAEEIALGVLGLPIGVGFYLIPHGVTLAVRKNSVANSIDLLSQARAGGGRRVAKLVEYAQKRVPKATAEEIMKTIVKLDDSGAFCSDTAGSGPISRAKGFATQSEIREATIFAVRNGTFDDDSK